MGKLFRDWYNRHFSDPQVALLGFLLILGFSIIIFAGKLLTPLFAAVIIAYLLDGGVVFLQSKKIPRLIAVVIIFSGFALLFLLLILVLAPLMMSQAFDFVRGIPDFINKGQQVLLDLPQNHPQLINEQTISELLAGIRSQVTKLSQQVLSFSLASVVDLFNSLVYLIVVPLLIFFFLKDKERILIWMQCFLPKERQLVTHVWLEVNQKIAGYVRGKFMEILIAWIVSYVTFLFLGLNFAMLLSFIVGISVLIPYVGAAIAAIPIAIIAYSQWGYNSDFITIIIAYAIIQFLDGNLLVPLLFSGMVNLHPAAIITAVLFFGGIWGFWGVFFAIPLATLIHAVINAWPKPINKCK